MDQSDVRKIELKPGNKIIVIADGIKYEIVKGSRVSSLEIFCPGREILPDPVDRYTVEVW